MTSQPSRIFSDQPAVRRAVPLLIGLAGPSGSGKTKSALRLAAGMQRVSGGDVGVVDTEARRALHYADDHSFRHIHFEAPFGPLDYLAAVEHFVQKGAKTVIVDSASHMHEGPGGTLETHDAELQRLAGDDHGKRMKYTMMAWQRPKAELQRFINAILQLQVNLILCFRAKPKLKIVKGKDPEPLGFMPISGDQLIYELTLSCLLYPNSGGVPSWQPEEMGERAIVKLPGQFRPMFEKRVPLDEAAGEALAKWAAGGAPAQAPATAPAARRDEVLMRLGNLGVNQARALAAIKRARVEDISHADVEALIALGRALKAGAPIDQVFPPVDEPEPGSDG